MQKHITHRINEPRIKTSLYYHLVTASWRKFVGYFIVSFVSIHLLFAGLYSLDLEGIQGEEHLSNNLRVFFFSVHTLSTIGYGNLTPTSLYIHSIVTLESFIALFYIALLTGCFFVKLAQTPSHIIFSRNAVIYPIQKIPHFSFRLVNALHDELIDVRVNAYVRYRDLSTNLYHLLPLTLKRDYTPSLNMNWVLLHEVAKGSPLFGISFDHWDKHGMQVFVNINAHNTVYQQQIHQSHIYLVEDILDHHAFEDMISVEEHRLVMDMSKIHAVYPLTRDQDT